MRNLWLAVEFNVQVTSSDETNKEHTNTAADKISAKFEWGKRASNRWGLQQFA